MSAGDFPNILVSYVGGVDYPGYALPYPSNLPETHVLPSYPTSLDTNPLFLALLRRVEMLEQRVNDLHANPDLNKAVSLTYG